MCLKILITFVTFVVTGGEFMRKAIAMIGIVAGIWGFVAFPALLHPGGMQSVFGMPAKLQAAAPPLPSIVQPSPASTGQVFIGRWSGRLAGDGTLEINPAPGGFNVALSVSDSSGCAGSIEGFGLRSGDTITLRTERNERVCTITIRFAGETAEVNENNCSDYHGAACGFRGTLTRED